MDFTEINSLVDNAISLATSYATQKQAYESQLASKDARIADLESQLKTVTATSSADEEEILSLHDKFTKLSELLNPQPATTTA